MTSLSVGRAVERWGLLTRSEEAVEVSDDSSEGRSVGGLIVHTAVDEIGQLCPLRSRQLVAVLIEQAFLQREIIKIRASTQCWHYIVSTMSLLLALIEQVFLARKIHWRRVCQNMLVSIIDLIHYTHFQKTTNYGPQNITQQRNETLHSSKAFHFLPFIWLPACELPWYLGVIYSVLYKQRYRNRR